MKKGLPNTVTVREKKERKRECTLPRDSGHTMCRCQIFESEEQRETRKVQKRKDCGAVKEGIGSIHESSWSCDQGRQRDEVSMQGYTEGKRNEVKFGFVWRERALRRN